MSNYTVISICLAVCLTLIGTLAAADSEADFERIRTEVWSELHLSLEADDTQGIQERRERLRQLFLDVPPGFARQFHDELGPSDTGGEFSEAFHGRLATAVRQQMLDILLSLDATFNPSENEPEEKPSENEPEEKPSAPFLGFGPMPPELEDDLQSILGELDPVIANLDSVRRKRISCMSEKLRNPAADDRVIKWRHICPSEFDVGKPFVTQCQIVGIKVSQTELYNAIKSESDVPGAGARLKFITHLRSLFLSDANFGTLGEASLKDINDQVFRTQDFLEEMTTAPLAGGSLTPKHYVYIKEWLKSQQLNSNSVLSCFRN